MRVLANRSTGFARAAGNLSKHRDYPFVDYSLNGSLRLGSITRVVFRPNDLNILSKHTAGLVDLLGSQLDSIVRRMTERGFRTGHGSIFPYANGIQLATE